MRADVYLVSMGLAESRERAKKLIEAERVIVNGVVLKKVSKEIADTDSVAVK